MSAHDREKTRVSTNGQIQITSSQKGFRLFPQTTSLRRVVFHISQAKNKSKRSASKLLLRGSRWASFVSELAL